jgi:Family of unknown function (DUF5898)
MSIDRQIQIQLIDQQHHQNRLDMVAFEKRSRALRDEFDKKMDVLGEDHRDSIAKERKGKEREIQLEFLRQRQSGVRPIILFPDLLKELESGNLSQFPLFRWDDFPDSNDCSNSPLHLPFGSGATSHCFFTVKYDGTVCVHKFFYPRFRHTNEKQLSEAYAERDAWNQIYRHYLGNFECTVGLDPQERYNYLQIPYIRALADTAQGEIDERRRLLKEGKQGALAQALRFFAAQGYRHKSIKWKHVGRESILPGSKIVFFDLGRVDRPARWEASDQEAWVEESLKYLESSM